MTIQWSVPARFALSILCAALAVVIVSFTISITERHLSPTVFINNFEGGVVGIGVFAAIGCVAALPFVLFVRTITRANWGWLLFVGTCIGPVTILLIGIVGFFVTGRDKSGWEDFLSSRILTLSGAVAFLTTLFYLLPQIRIAEASNGHHDC